MIYEKQLTAGKSDQYGRSHGFFVRVRGRIINLEDELFGLDALNHSAWSRFAMELDADGLRDHLLSSREGVRDSEAIHTLRSYMHAKFNSCRQVYERVDRENLIGLDIQQLLTKAPSRLAAGPLVEAVRAELSNPNQELYYIRAPRDLAENDQEAWLGEFRESVMEQPFSSLDVRARDPYERAAEYDAGDRSLHINDAHPFVSKLAAHSRNRTPLVLFGTSEILADALLREVGVEGAIALEYFERRDRALRLIAGDQPPDALEVMRQLDIADTNEDALERAVGEAFEVLGFKYEPRGGKRGGTDGVLDAYLGRHLGGIATYRVVYDAKTTDRPSVPADKIDFSSLLDFKRQEQADFAFFVAKRFEGQDEPSGKLNRKIEEITRAGQPVTVLLTQDVRALVRLHVLYGVTLTRMRGLFESAHTVQQTHDWVAALTNELGQSGGQVPLGLLLGALEKSKSDPLSTPNARQVRGAEPLLKSYEPDKLIAALRAVETLVGSHWMEVEPTSGDVIMHQRADEIVGEVQRRLADDLHSLEAG